MQTRLILAAALLAWSMALFVAQAKASPPLVEPNFLLPVDAEVSDYRPALNVDGTIFIQDSAGTRPAMQVSDCDNWNVQHPKWFPPGPTGISMTLIAAVAQPGMNEPFAIASFDVSAFVGRH